MTNDRIRLAEAMGWTECFEVQENEIVMSPVDRYRFMGVEPDGDGSVYAFIPDPFTDANDDYAVLEWARKNWQGKDGHHGHWHQFAQSLWHRWDEYDVTVPYQIGDYARAALKVIDDEN